MRTGHSPAVNTHTLTVAIFDAIVTPVPKYRLGAGFIPVIFVMKMPMTKGNEWFHGNVDASINCW